MTSGERNEFLTSMGHELRNPLTSIIAHAETLLEGVYGPLEDAQKTALMSIQSSVRHMLGLVSDVVDLSRIESSPPDLHPTICCLREVCESSLKLVDEQAHARSTRIVSEIHPHDLSVMADAQRLRQIVTELLSAALLSAPTGSQLRLGVSSENGGLLIQAQNCTSHPPTAHEQAAEADAAPSPVMSRLRKLKPVGIALLHNLVHHLGGRFSVAETAEHVVSMSIRLPLSLLPYVADQTAHAAPADDSQSSCPPLSHTPTILIADDQHALVSVTRNYLESIGFQVETARDGREAVHLALTRQLDLILMDVHMPVLDGLKAIRQIRESDDPKIRSVPIISLSGLNGVADKEKCLAAGATSYLSKPFGVKELDRIITSYIQTTPPLPLYTDAD